MQPLYGPGFGALAYVYLLNNNFREAERCFRQALDLAPDTPERAHSLGRFYDAMRKPGLAAQYYRRALQLDPTFPPALRYLGALRDQGNDQVPPEAEPIFDGSNTAAGENNSSERASSAGCFGMVAVSLVLSAAAIRAWLVH